MDKEPRLTVEGIKMTIAIIGGSGLYNFKDLIVRKKIRPATPYGDISDELVIGEFAEKNVLFLPRHGCTHQIPPHKVNYRANIWALKEAGVSHIIAINAVGGIADYLTSGDIVIPDQIIDYTYGREHTFSDGNSGTVQHIDFSQPFDEKLRAIVIGSLNPQGPYNCHSKGVYGCTQGPRLETAAEVQRLKNDGCTVVGMTVMPEAALAKELSIPYVAINIVANLAAGLSAELITMEEITQVVEKGHRHIQGIIKNTLLHPEME